MAETILRKPVSKYAPDRPLTPQEQQFVADNMGLASKEAARIARAIVAGKNVWRGYRQLVDQFYEELVDAGWTGLCVGIQRYVPNEKCKAQSYAYHYIRRDVQIASAVAEIRATHSRHSSSFKSPRVAMLSELNNVERLAGETTRTFDVWDDRHGDDPTIPTEPSAELKCLVSLVLGAERSHIVCEIVFHDRTVRDVAADLGCSYQAVQQRFVRAVAELRGTAGFMEALYRMNARERRLRDSDFSEKNIGKRIA